MSKAIDDAYDFDESVLPTYIDAERLLNKLKADAPAEVECSEEACNLLLHYDKDKDGVLSKDEVIASVMDFYTGKISKEAILYVIMCYFNGSIEKTCPGCYKTEEEEPKCCDEVCFSELVKCYEEDNYKKAWGWTASTGQSGHWKYNPPAPWEYDPDYKDERDRKLGSHGGCPNCIMTLVHLRKSKEEEEIVPPEYIEVSRSRDADIPINWGSPLDGYVPIPYTESVTVKNPFYRNKITGELFGEFAGFFDGRGYEGMYVIAEWQATSCEKKTVPLEKGYIGKVEYDLCKKGFAHLILTEWPDVEEEGPDDSDMCTINIPTPGYLIDGAKTPVTLKCEAPLVPTGYVDDFIYECTKTISMRVRIRD